MRNGKWRGSAKRAFSILMAGIILATTLTTSVYAVHTYHRPEDLAPDEKKRKDWTWSAEGETAANSSAGLIPTGLSQQETALMGSYTSKFWLQAEKARTIPLQGDSKELDFAKFHHRYFACADSHSTGFFAPVGAQIAFKKMYYPTENINDYPEFLKNAPMDMETKKFVLLLISLISAAYETPSLDDLKDSDNSSMYYYLLWASIWSNDKYVDMGMFTGESPEKDWDFVQDFVRVMLKSRLDPDEYGSTAIYDAFRGGGPAEKYFFHCWRAAKFLSSFAYAIDVGNSLPACAPLLGDDGMYHMTFRYDHLMDYEKEAYRRLKAEELASGWTYYNDGSSIDFKSAEGITDGNAIAVLRLEERSEEDHFYNCGFGIGGLAGFQGCAKKGEKGEFGWGNTQVYFSAVSEPLEIIVGGSKTAKPPEGMIEVHRYKHSESWEAHYNIELRKYDSETGQPLAGSKWDILEAFDDEQLEKTDLNSQDNWANREGCQFMSWEGWDFGEGNPDGDAANDPCPWDINVTGEDGLLMLGDNEDNASGRKAHTDIKTYTYTKGYCGGHPEPEIEESGDPEIDAMNEEAAKEAWQEEVDMCEALAAQGGFFHSIGQAEAKAQMEADRDAYYTQFIALKYEYSAVELAPRPGYTVHGSHTDDIPIEIKTVTSSEYKDSAHAVSAKEASDSLAKEEPENPDIEAGEAVATPSVADTPDAMDKLPVVTAPDAFAAATAPAAAATTAPAAAATTVPAAAATTVPAAAATTVPAAAATTAPAAAATTAPAAGIASDATATASDAAATASDAKKQNGLIQRLKALFELPKRLFVKSEGKRLSIHADEKAIWGIDYEPSDVEPIIPGDGGMIDHTFIVYDHRTEGEIHINKRDLYLKSGEGDGYDAYGDSMGDGTLEGAVYGLFALKDINHPDGRTGTVYQQDDLVAVAATDRNGDASFMAFTEAPGKSWNNQTGSIEKRSSSFEGPSNLYRNKEDADKSGDHENYAGHDSYGNLIHLIDSESDGKDGYWKHSSNQPGISGLVGEFAAYPLSDNEKINGNCWIGRPLIAQEHGTPYYVKELTRSEGYELSVNGKENLITNGRGSYDGEYHAANVEIGKITLDTVNGGNYFDIRAQNADHDVTLQGMDFPEGALFELTTDEKTPETITVPIYSTVTKPVMAKAGEFVYRSGRPVAADIGDTITFPTGQSYTVNAASGGEDKTIGVKPLNYHTMGIPDVTELHSGGAASDFQDFYNAELESMGYKQPGEEAPWVRVKLGGNTDTEWILSITAAVKDHDLQYFNSLRITDMVQSEGSLYAIMRYEWKLYGDSRDDAVYVPDKNRLYLKKDSGNGYFVYAIYDDLDSNQAVCSYSIKDDFLFRAVLKDQSVTGLSAAYPDRLPLSFAMVNKRTPSYWIYAAGEQQIDDSGDLRYTEETQVEYIEQDGFRVSEKKVKLVSEYDVANRIYTVTLPAAAFETSDLVRLKVSDNGSGMYSTKQAYISQSSFAYLPLRGDEDTYIQNITLTKPVQTQPWQDENTRKEPVRVLERPIMQKIKVVKDILNDENMADYQPGFRFKAYLKTNLEQLYRSEDGEVEWMDRNGNVIDIAKHQEAYPEIVQKIYTKVPHQSSPLSRRSNAAAIANKELYAFPDGQISEKQEPGYTAVLETIFQNESTEGEIRKRAGYNYEKFFDAIGAANEDKWDQVQSRSTSFKPIAYIKELLFGIRGAEAAYPAGHNNPVIANTANTSESADNNRKSSDSIRQFAIRWYLDFEVEKLVKANESGEMQGRDGGGHYQDEIYDAALKAAIEKAENYLKPFFSNDLDRIYSIWWDSAPGGGFDKDNATLSAEEEDPDSGYCFGVSEYLPYGTYVVAEQQPTEKKEEDIDNRNYRIDAPKEIELPSVYEEEADADKIPERLDNAYLYHCELPVSGLASAYFIRFNEEWPDSDAEKANEYIIKAHGYLGDYEIYKYGLSLQKLDKAAEGDPRKAPRFNIVQDVYDPLKDYYNTIVNQEKDGGNSDSHYFADDVNNGKRAPNGREYETDGIEKVYHYGCVSEERQIYDEVLFPEEKEGIFKGRIMAMEGMQTAYDGRYASMLVPWTVTEPVAGQKDAGQKDAGQKDAGQKDAGQKDAGQASTVGEQGFGYMKFHNAFYLGHLRIEKLDSETGENILHDGAIFTLYAAEQQKDGHVRFYEEDTRLTGSKEFLEALGAEQIKKTSGTGELWSGIVQAGAPACSENDQIIMTDAEGMRTGRFEAFTTTRDGLQAEEESPEELSSQNQNVGYLTTPQPLGAGAYVLCEMRAPAGYTRTKPVAIEVYSDRVSYYLDGNRNNRIAAAVYEEDGANSIRDTARIYAGNTPVRLEISKIKEKENTVVYRTDTRLDGSEAELNAKYGRENLEFAYKSGKYLNYAWYKGSAEYIEGRKAAGELAEAVCVDGVFAGYGLITKKLETAADANRYVAGAKMTLYDAIEIKKNDNGGDHGYDGVTVERDRNNNVQSIKILEGHAGNCIEFVNSDDVEGSLRGNAGNGTWTYKTIERKDAEILFYSLTGLKLTEQGADGRTYGYDRDGKRIQVKNVDSIFAVQNGRPVFELSGGDLEHAQYSPLDKCFVLSKDTLLYHLDSEGNKEAKADPSTGMAYATETYTDANGKELERILAWPVHVSKTEHGAVIAREKIKTYRIAAINSDTEKEYTIGTYDGITLKKQVNPVINSHGLPEYYQRSNQTYVKGAPVYDIDQDYVRYRYEDLLFAFNRDAYRINEEESLRDIGEEEDITDDKKLYHRQGEAWIMENTWISGEKYPNDPFAAERTMGRADVLKRVIPGSYIMEESKVPEGYAKGLPVGITVKETDRIQSAELEDEIIKIEIVKTDAADQYRIDVVSDYQENLKTTEPKGAYSYGQIAGAHLILYKARRIDTTDTKRHPEGYYLEKAEDFPAEWTVEDAADHKRITIKADWITDGKPKYFEGIPAGDYILEETEAGSGYVRHSMGIEVKKTGKVQTFHMKDDHTKLEIYKYCIEEGKSRTVLDNGHAAGLALYKAKTDESGNIVTVGGEVQYADDWAVDEWMTDDLKAYTEIYEKDLTFSGRIKAFFGLESNRSGFIMDFEKEYQKRGEDLVWMTWHTNMGTRTAKRISSIKTEVTDHAVHLWKTDEGKIIRITIYRNVLHGSLDQEGRLPLNFEYQFNYRELPMGMKSYDTQEGMHRIDYLPFTDFKEGRKVGNYVLVETSVPEGYEPVKPKAIVLEEDGNVHRFSLENTEKYISVLKAISDGTDEYAADHVKLALYRPDASGNYTGREEDLIERWISGEDGRYTSEDHAQGKIPDGFRVGDRKPHRISKISDGIYYIAEEEVPAYMAKSDPLKIEINSQTPAIVRMVNHLSQGRLEIVKKSEDTGEMLENARFLLTNRDTDETWHITTGSDGRAELHNLAVGKLQPDGVITPYTYSIEELSPPDLYQISGGKKFFTFEGGAGASVAVYTFEAVNKPTDIWFKKTDFDTGMAIEGAKIAVYHAVLKDGEYGKEGEAIETAVSGPSGFRILKKLSAGHVYIMEEQEAPAGAYLSPPVIFKVNRDGTGICFIKNHFSVLECEGANKTIHSLTVFGRSADKTVVILKDLDTGEALPEIISSTGVALTAADGIKNGHLYEIAEYTRYCDGNTELSKKETRRISFEEGGAFFLPTRTYLETRLQLAGQEGRILDAWNVDESSFGHITYNPIVKEPVIAEIARGAGSGQTSVQSGDVITYGIAYENPHAWPAEIVVEAKLNDGLEFMRASIEAENDSGKLIWKIQNVEPHTAGRIEMAAVVTGREGEAVKPEFTSGAGADKKTSVSENPIAPKGSLTIRNHMTGTGKNPKDCFTYQIRFSDQSGKLLTSYQDYSGCAKGRIKGSGKVSLKGEEYIIFSGLPYGINYEIIPEGSHEYKTVGENESGVIAKEAKTAVYVNHKDDEAVREILTAGGNYSLTETTSYSDGSEQISGIYRFTLNDSGRIDNVDMEDRLIKAFFSKSDFATGEELSGGHYVLLDAETKEAIYEYSKEDEEPMLIPAELLLPGKAYILQESQPPSGYAWEKDVHFTVNEDGIPETIIMQDKKTVAYLEKVDADTGEALTGGRYSVRDMKSGETIFQYTAEGRPIAVEGILIAGGQYELVEEEPPDGYEYCRSIVFTVPQTPEAITIVMEDRKTEILIKKLTVSDPAEASPSEADRQKSGFVLQILNQDKSPARAIREFSGFHTGEELIFTTTEAFKTISGQLTVGGDYWLHEIRPKDGYAAADDVPFTVGKNGGCEIVVMIDKPTYAVLSKKEITGSTELPGNDMAVRDDEGNVLERWISEEVPHEIIAKLKAGKTYYLCEEIPKKGFSWAERVPFTVSEDGSVDMVEMRNDMTKVLINKKDVSGNAIKGAVLQILGSETESVIMEFETTGEPVEASGKLTAGESYYLHEKKAPFGYLPSADVPFTVPRGNQLIEVTMIDLKRSDGEDGSMYLMKTDAATGEGLEGFAFEVTRPSGETFTVVTGNGGKAEFAMPPDGTYTYRETKAQAGYLISEESYSFTIYNRQLTMESTILVADQRLPDGQPDTRIGRITASYKPMFQGASSTPGKGGSISSEKTGDWFPLVALAAVMLLSFGGLVYRIKKSISGNHDGEKNE